MKGTVFRVYAARTIGLILLIGICTLLLGMACWEPLVRRFSGVKEGVTYLEIPMEGKLEQEVEKIVAESAPQFYREPLPAYIDPVTRGLIVEMNGFRLNQEETVKAILAAEAETAVAPVLREYPPETTRDDFPLAPVYQGRPEIKAAALMINVAWGNEYIASILQLLAQHNARATFFLIGRWAEGNSGLVKQIINAGHQIETHGYSDAALPTDFSPEELQLGLQRCTAWMEEVCGRRPRYYAPHAGDFDEAVIAAAREEGMTTVLWSLDTVDWKKPGVDWMFDRVMNNIHNGAMILMHPTEDTAAFLDICIPALQEKGYVIATLDEMLAPGVIEGWEQ